MDREDRYKLTVSPGSQQSLPRRRLSHPLPQCWLGQCPRGCSVRVKTWYFCLANPPTAAAGRTNPLRLFNSWTPFDEAKPSSHVPSLFARTTRERELASVPSLCPVFRGMMTSFPATQLLRTKDHIFPLRAGGGTQMCFSLFGLFYSVSSCWGSLLWGSLGISSHTRLALP